MKIVRRTPRIFHPLRFFLGLALLFAGLYFAIGLQTTVNYMGYSILLLMSLDASGINFGNWEFIAGLGMSVAAIVLLFTSSSKNGPRKTGKRRFLMYPGILWIGLLFIIFGSYILFDPSTGTDIINGTIVQMIYLQLGALFEFGIRLWVGLGLILVGIAIMSWFSFGHEKRDEYQAPEKAQQEQIQNEVSAQNTQAPEPPPVSAPLKERTGIEWVSIPQKQAPTAGKKAPPQKADGKEGDSTAAELERQIVKKKLMEKRARLESRAPSAK